ncbi:MAG: GNAT family N-acetyltransferase [Desulfotignum sp.]
MAARLKSDPETNTIPVVIDTAPEPSLCRHCPLDFFSDMDKVCRWYEKQTDPVCFSVTARLDVVSLPSDLPGMLTEWINKGLKMIQWQCPKHLGAMPAGLLWQTAKAGIWNHVLGPDLFAKGAGTVPAGFILNHPHVVYSFDLPENGLPPGMAHAYDDIDPLPGIPFWQTLTGPDAILSCLTRYPASHLARIRWDHGIRLVLGKEIQFYFVSPTDLPPGYLDQVHAMVLAGGSVDSAYVRANLENAYLIGYALENQKIVGCSCLKHPRDALIRRLKTATGMDFSGCVERGYTSVRPEYRSLGVGRRLLEGLTAQSGKYQVFAIIDENNLATQKIARWNDTRKITTYFSEKTNKQMGIWMPAHMRPPEKENDPGPEQPDSEDIQ